MAGQRIFQEGLGQKTGKHSEEWIFQEDHPQPAPTTVIGMGWGKGGERCDMGCLPGCVSASDARPKGRSGHRPGQGPRPVELSKRSRMQVKRSRMRMQPWLVRVVVVVVVVVVTCQASITSRRRRASTPPTVAEEEGEGPGLRRCEQILPVASPSSLSSLMQAGGRARVCRRRGERWEGPGARVLPWGLLDVPDLLGRLAHKKTNFQYWLSANPTEKKQHVKVWVKRYPKDTGVPVPQECHDWVKTCFVLVEDREPPAEGGDTGPNEGSEAGDKRPKRTETLDRLSTRHILARSL